MALTQALVGVQSTYNGKDAKPVDPRVKYCGDMFAPVSAIKAVKMAQLVDHLGWVTKTSRGDTAFVLDLACGRGGFAPSLVKAFRRCVTVDLRADRLRFQHSFLRVAASRHSSASWSSASTLAKRASQTP